MGFAEDTHVARIAPERWAGAIAPGWDIGGNANGGYLLGLTARAMREASGCPDPVTVTAHYLRPGKPGKVEVTCEVVKQGRRFTTVDARLTSDAGPLIQVLGTFGDLSGAAGGPERMDSAPPELPPPASCPRNRNDSGTLPFMERVELRLHPEDIGFRTGDPSGVPRVRGWFRFADGAPTDALALLLAVDAFPPTIFNARLPVSWVPTLELTAHVRGRPAPGWLRCAFTTRFVSGGFLEEDGEVWDDAGRLVAQSRQLALVPQG